MGPSLGTRSPHGDPGLQPRERHRRPPTRAAATPPSDHPHGPQRRPVGSPPHSTLLGSRTPQQPGHTRTHRALGQAGNGHEHLPPPPPFRKQPGRTAMANRPPGDRTQAHRPHGQPRESDHADAGRTPAKGSGPAGYAPSLPTPRPPSPTTSGPTQASETEKRRTRPEPPASQIRRQGNNLPTPRTPPDNPGKPGPSILIILPPATSTALTQSVPRIQKRAQRSSSPSATTTQAT